MSSIKDKVNELNHMIIEGKILDAFDKFYAPNVVMADNDNPPREGKVACRKFEEDFVSKRLLPVPLTSSAPEALTHKISQNEYKASAPGCLHFSEIQTIAQNG